jgi:hypothetical protein
VKKEEGTIKREKGAESYGERAKGKNLFADTFGGL